MRKLLTFLLLIKSLQVFSAVYFVSTDGKDSNPGTFDYPWLTWQKGFDIAVAGDTVFIRGGIYYTEGVMRGDQCVGVHVSGRNGTILKKITIQSYLNEVPVLDGSIMTSNSRRCGMYFNNCSYYTLKGLTVRNVKEYGQFTGCPLAESVVLARCNHMTFERCVVYDCGNGFSSNGFCDHIEFINCDSYNNIDFSDDGGYSNGWTLTMYLSPGVYASGTHVSLIGCRSWGNSDDGFDMFGANGYFEYTDCWAFDNGRYDGNGDGFKSHQKGEIEIGVQRTYIRCISFYNKGSGFTSPPYAVEHLYHCVSYNNGENGIGYNTGANLECVFRNNISIRNRHSQYAGLSSHINTHNSWNHRSSAGKDDFISTDTTGVRSHRQSDGSLPELTFLRLRNDSQLVDAGFDLGLPFAGDAPDLGAYEAVDIITPPSKKDKNLMLKMYLLFLLPWI